MGYSMGTRPCEDTDPFAFDDECVRASWSAFLPAAFVFALCLFSVPIPKVLENYNPFKALFTPFIGLQEAEELDAKDIDAASRGPNEDEDRPSPMSDTQARTPLWRTLTLVFVPLVESLIWLGIGVFYIVVNHDDGWNGIRPILVASSWLYAAFRPILHPLSTMTAPLDLFAIYTIHLLAGILLLGGVLYEHGIYDLPLPRAAVFTALASNVVAVLVLLSIVLRMPLGVPSTKVKRSDIGVSVSPEDYTTLWGWLTFSWVYPLIKRGTNATLEESDVWRLSPTMQSRPVFIKYNSIESHTLLRKLWRTNTLDILLDIILTISSVFLNYLGPLFLKLILDSIDNPLNTSKNRANAYIYAFLAFACSVAKTQTELSHLWYSRRAATRMRSALMAAIYEKSLKRKDYSGIVDQEKADKADVNKDGTPGSAKDDKQKEKDDNDPKAGADVGKIVNLMAGDAHTISNVVTGAYFLYGAPFELTIVIIFLYKLLGWAAFSGFLVIAALMPVNATITRLNVKIQKGISGARDKRMGVINELIGAVKLIKFFAWEEQWIKRAIDAREVEMGWMIKSRIAMVALLITWIFTPIIVSVVAFLVFVAQGNELTVSIAFTAISLFGMLNLPLNIIPIWAVQVLQARVALDRVAKYLDEDEVSEQTSTLKASDLHTRPTSTGGGFGIENGSFKWNEVEKDKENTKADLRERETDPNEINTSVESQSDGAHHFELRDISVVFPEGKLTIITGPTASGKTALLLSLLGETTILRGELMMLKDPSDVDENGLMRSISYAAQSPWLQHQTIKENILFGYPFDEDRYNAVIESCALKPDLDIFEDGDATEIGSRGVSLSGGQKARVALARAVYARTKYVLLDDPLSAVDSHTSQILFERLLCGPLLANRTVILVTHHVQLVLPATSYLVRMLDGRIDSQGTIEELRSQGVLDEIAHDSATESQKEVAPQPPELVLDATEQPPKSDKTPKKLVEEENRETGHVKWPIYQTYLRAASYWVWAILGFFILLSEILGVLQKLWIKVWGEAYGKDISTTGTSYMTTSFAAQDSFQSISNRVFAINILDNRSSLNPPPFGWPSAGERPMLYVGVYAAIGSLAALSSLLFDVAQYVGAIRASRVLYIRLVNAVVRATFRWHDSNPKGRMLNRFGKDIETIDNSLSTSLVNLNSCLATFAVSILTVAVVFPAFLIPAFFIAFGYYRLSVGYMNTGRDLRRMEANTRSPIFSGFGELLEGIITVRAFSSEKRFLDQTFSQIDTTSRMLYTFWMTNRWLLLNFDILGALAVLVTTLFALSGLVSAGLAGLCITSAMSFTMSIYWACRFFTNLQMDLNSVERVVEYLDLPQEPPAIIESNRPPAYWPSSTDSSSLVVVEDLVVKYAPELPAVLHGISFSLKANERVGILGRTGSGKSTLAMSILRFVDPAGGRILIDGIDISTIGVQDLRSRLTFVPQDATLFSGSLRENLDPFGEHDDAECVDVLYRVQMLSQSAHQSQRSSRAPSRASLADEVIEREDLTSSISPTIGENSKSTVTLETQVSPEGSNFSQGQRQLIAMARALLRRSSIIILDEATSSIDFAADTKIQATIREEFNGCLLITIAHRIRTVIDYDRLLVLDKGQVAEFDTPLNLIQKEGGIFKEMCMKSGNFKELEAAAKAKAEHDLLK